MELTFVYFPAAQDVLTDEEWQVVERYLLENPTAGDVIPGTGGLRKLRVAFANRGKRGSARTVYLHVMSKETVYFLAAYAKNVQEDLTNDQKKALRALVATLKE
jgi:hypothetical protein